MKVTVVGKLVGNKELVFEGHPAIVARQLAVRFRWVSPVGRRPLLDAVVEEINAKRGYRAVVERDAHILVNGQPLCRYLSTALFYLDDVCCSSDDPAQVAAWAEQVRAEAPGARVEVIDGQCAECGDFEAIP